MTPQEDRFERDGRLWLRDALNATPLAALDRVVADGSQPGKRLSLAGPVAGALATADALAQSVRAVLPDAQAVRAVSFTKNAASNWSVPWHQDRVIAVQDRVEKPGFGSGSLKTGTWHCEPPLEILNRMIFVRLHLDDCDASNGAMEIAVGSHRQIVPSHQAEQIAAQYPREITTARRGDILILKMLALHRSRPAEGDAPRRVLRLDYAQDCLPAPLAWAH